MGAAGIAAAARSETFDQPARKVASLCLEVCPDRVCQPSARSPSPQMDEEERELQELERMWSWQGPALLLSQL